MAAERLANALRRLIDLAVRTKAPPAALETAAGELDAIAERLEGHALNEGRTPQYPDMQNLQFTFGTDPVIGVNNPIAPPVRLAAVDGAIRGTVNLGRPYEGPPGYAHGAIVAAIFDLVSGLANVAGGKAGMTGTLTVRYRKPTPLYTDLEIEGRLVRVDGRKGHIEATIRAGGEVTAEAEAVMIELEPHHAEAYFQHPEVWTEPPPDRAASGTPG